jgi:hypothetical protein
MFSKLSLEQKEEKSLNKRIEYSTVKVKTRINSSENQFRESSCFGFIIYNDIDLTTNNIYLILPLHGISDEDVDSIHITKLSVNKVHKYKSTSFYKNDNIDLAAMHIKKNLSLYKDINIDNLIKISDLNLTLNTDSFLFNFYFTDIQNKKTVTANNISLKPRGFQKNSSSKDILGPSITLKSCQLDTKKKSDIYLKLCNGLSGLLSFNKDNNYIDSIFTGTSNGNFLFLPILYVKYFIEQITFKNKELGMNFIPIKANFNESNNLCVLSEYDKIKKEDIMVAINKNCIEQGYVYVEELQTKIPIDQYIMLYCDNKCLFTIIRNYKIIECDVSCIKVK